MDNEMANLITVHTCSICGHLFHLTKKLFNEAIALKSCSHIFCWKCIHDKIIQQNWQLCPVCNFIDEFGPDALRRLSHEDELIDIEDYDGDDDDDDDMDMDENAETVWENSNDEKKKSNETNVCADEKKEFDDAEDMEM